MKFDERLFSIIIIRIDDYKRFVDRSLAGKHRLTGSPRFRSAFRLLESFRQSIQFLEYVTDIHQLFHTFSDGFPEIFFQVFADDEHYFIESGFDRIMDGIIHDNLSVRSHRFQLLDSFSKTAADSGGHNHQCRIFHDATSCIVLYFSLHPRMRLKIHSCNFQTCAGRFYLFQPSCSCILLSFAAWSAAIRLSMISSRSPSMILFSLYKVSLILWSVTRPCGKL